MKESEPLARRRKTVPVRVGKLAIGSGNPVVVQSMTNTDSRDAEATLSQIESLAAAGCELVRLAVPDRKASGCLRKIVDNSPVPLVADIHFNHRLALDALEAGIAKLRINPGNIGGADKVKVLAREASSCGVPIRIGVNAGSLEKDLLESHGGPTAEALAASAVGHCRLLEDEGFGDIVVSIKASDVPTTVRANRLFATQRNYPIHLGVTEAGTMIRGTVNNSAGIAIMLAEGIGDTLRVSLTADPVEEVGVAWKILAALGERKRGAEVISCPTCGRTEVDIIGLAGRVEHLLRTVELPMTVAVMGCVVNGPGEAREADYGIAAGKGNGLLLCHGKSVGRAAEENLVEELLSLIERESGISIPRD